MRVGNLFDEKSIMRVVQLLTLAGALVVGHTPDASWADDATRLLVVNAQSQSSARSGFATWLDPVSYAKLAQVFVGYWPQSPIVGPGRRFLYVPCAGDGTRAGSISVLDLETMTKVTDIPTGIHSKLGNSFDYRAAVTPDGSKVIALPVGNQKVTSKIIVIDRETHQPLGSVTTGLGAVDYALAPDGRLAFVLHQADDASLEDAPASLVLVDLEQPALFGERELGPGISTMRRSEDGRMLYVLSAGLPAGKGLPGEGGRLWILDGSTGEEKASVDLGFEPVMHFDSDSDRLLVASSGAPGKGGLLHWIEGAEVLKEIEVRGKPEGMAMGKDSESVFLFGAGGIEWLDLAGVSETARFKVPFRPSALLLGPDGKRAFVKEERGSEVALLDLEKKRLTGAFKTGRAGAKIGRAITVLSGTSALDVALTTVGLILTTRATLTDMHIDPDGRYLSVINDYTNDVTIIDVEQARVLDKLKTGAGTARLLGTEDGEWLVVLGTGKLSLIDVAKQKKRATIDLGLEYDEAPRAPIIREDRNELLALTKTGLVVVSLENGRTKKTVLLSSVHLPLHLVEIEPKPVAMDARGPRR